MKSIATHIGRFLNAALEMIYPACCEVCGEPLLEGEDTLCLKCLMTIPRTGYHRSSFNEIHKRLATPHIPIERAASYFHYTRQSPYSSLIRSAKYNSRPSIAGFLGRSFATELLPEGFFDGIDVMIPVPLHLIKFARRGYNQSTAICRGISEITCIGYDTSILSVERHTTQTRKTASERMKNVAGAFHCRPCRELDGKHVLIVDDVITTGATMLGALTAFHNANPGTRISVLSLASTR